MRAYAQGMRPVDMRDRYLTDPDDDEALTEHQAIARILTCGIVWSSSHYSTTAQKSPGCSRRFADVPMSRHDPPGRCAFVT
ncbi:hypothetical protein ACTMU2_37430 [Cupriavidus basilensis]